MIILNSKITSVLVRRGVLPVFSIGVPKIVIILKKLRIRGKELCNYYIQLLIFVNDFINYIYIYFNILE
jgi:hypothetical protein